MSTGSMLSKLLGCMFAGAGVACMMVSLAMHAGTKEGVVLSSVGVGLSLFGLFFVLAGVSAWGGKR